MPRILTLALLVLLVNAPVFASGRALASVSLDPPNLVMDRPGAPRQLLVTGHYADGSIADLTDRARFYSASTTVATIGAGGLLAPKSPGRTVIAVRVAGHHTIGVVVVKGTREPLGWSFAARIEPILTHAGCNNGSCHGSPVGKGGFRLSLFGGFPDRDYRAIAREGSRRRIDIQNPAASLILAKPTLRIGHKGGMRFAVGSPKYRTLEAWIRAGAPEADSRAAKVTGLEILPRGSGSTPRLLFGAGRRQRLVALARYSDGTAEDVTRLCVFSTGDPGVAEVDAAGSVTAIGQGEAPVLVRYGGLITASTCGVVTQPSVKDFPYVSGENVVDRYVFPKLRALHIRPAPPCSDAEFLRRAALDLTGTLPTAVEARAFLADTRPDKRSRLAEALLARPEYADFQALLWADRLRSNSRFHRIGGVRAYQKWLRESFLANLPLDTFARKLITSRGRNYEDGASNYYGNYDVISKPEETALITSQLFLGVRLHCAQCHNHPFEKWTQDDFYSLAAVFAQVRGRNTKNVQEFELYLDPKATVSNPDSGQVMAARGPGSPVLTTGNGDDVRLQFADWLLAPENPFFARAMVNRLWRQLMGRGLVEPVDDFRVTNPPTHPELLGALARELIASHFDQKRVIRLIVNSRAYQASSAADAANRDDFKYYSRAYPKRMPAEVYFDAVCQVTGKPEEFKAWPEAKRAIQLPENRYPSYFMETFGRSNRLVICEREQEGTLSQALNLINGREIQDRVAAKDGALARLLASGKSDAAATDVLFLATLSRLPRDDERRRLAAQMARAPSREEAFQDLLWALLSSREFQFNH